MKGQAFDVFKLMIAAVVAVAILAILLGILRGISPAVGDPLAVTQQLLRDCYSGKIAKTSPNPVTFRQGDAITVDSIVSGTGIPASAVKVDTDVEELSISGSVIQATSTVTVKVIVDCLPSHDITGDCGATCCIKYTYP